jgi:inhibitor of KinA sporulation pathway (predicted exonuclease)
MKALEKALRGKRILVFLDLEGTQFTHEMIEIGAYLAVLRDDLSVKRILPGYKTYVKAKHPIGSVVRELTGITEEKLRKDGIPFNDAMSGLHKYAGKYAGKCVYVTFGSHDLKIIQESVANNEGEQKEFYREIAKEYLDFSAFVSTYVKDDKGNPLSLVNYLKTFKVPFQGKAHDALADAYNLIDLYKAVLEKKDILKTEYMLTLARMSHLPSPIAHIVRELNEKKVVTPDDWETAVKESLK